MCATESFKNLGHILISRPITVVTGQLRDPLLDLDEWQAINTTQPRFHTNLVVRVLQIFSNLRLTQMLQRELPSLFETPDRRIHVAKMTMLDSDVQVSNGRCSQALSTDLSSFKQL